MRLRGFKQVSKVFRLLLITSKTMDVGSIGGQDVTGKEMVEELSSHGSSSRC